MILTTGSLVRAGGTGSRSEQVRSTTSAAGGADADQVEPVVLDLEVVQLPRLAHRPLELLLEAVGDREVTYRPTGGADQVMVVAGQVVGQLEAGVLLAGGDAADHPGLLEDGEVPIGGGLGQGT